MNGPTTRLQDFSVMIKKIFLYIALFLTIWAVQAVMFSLGHGKIVPIDFIISAFYIPGYAAVFFMGRWLFLRQINMLLKLLLLIGISLITAFFSLILTNEVNFNYLIDVYFVSAFTGIEMVLLQLAFALMAWGVSGVEQSFQHARLKQELEHIKVLEAAAREKNLMQHLQPHFLFNALNTVYALSRKNAPEAPTAILELSELLRYSIDSAKNMRTPLSNEIRFLKDYCAFQQKRLPVSTKVKLNVSIWDEKLQVPPLLFQPLVENAFKYVTDAPGARILIDIQQNNETITFHCANTNLDLKKREEIISGSGIDLFEERLKAVYGNIAEFLIISEKPDFIVECVIIL